MLVLDSSSGIVAGEPSIDRVIALDPYFWRKPSAYLRPRTWVSAYQTLQALRATHYDIAVSICGDLASIFARLSRAPRRIGYANEAYAFMLTDPVPGGRYYTRKHEMEYCLALARAAGGVVKPQDHKLQLPVDPESLRGMSGRIRHLRQLTQIAGPLVVMHAGARNGQAKRWPIEHLAALAQRLVFRTAGPRRAYWRQVGTYHCRGVVELANVPQLVNMVGETSLSELVALLSLAQVVVTGDSGPMHIASAVGTRIVALHGPTDPALSGPVGETSIVLRQPLWCAPCYDPRQPQSVGLAILYV